ncbi:MAG: helix-turn-helix transcriptional regulator, partial [Candidatus Eremiobacterales bacterium]
MKSERLLAMLLMLQARGRASAREIASSLEVSERTVYRDLDSLSAAGIPVHAERGARGGIVLADGYRRALTQFRDEEIRALFVSAAETLADVGLGDNLKRALEKLSGALTESQTRAAANVRGRIHIDPRRWKQAEQPRAMLSALRTACAEDRRTVLHYRDRNAKVSERIVEPLGLVAKAGVWYLVARYGPEMRVFRADRMLGLDVMPERFERPPRNGPIMRQCIASYGWTSVDASDGATKSASVASESARARKCLMRGRFLSPQSHSLHGRAALVSAAREPFVLAAHSDASRRQPARRSSN